MEDDLAIEIVKEINKTLDIMEDMNMKSKMAMVECARDILLLRKEYEKEIRSQSFEEWKPDYNISHDEKDILLVLDAYETKNPLFWDKKIDIDSLIFVLNGGELCECGVHLHDYDDDCGSCQYKRCSECHKMSVDTSEEGYMTGKCESCNYINVI